MAEKRTLLLLLTILLSLFLIPHVSASESILIEASPTITSDTTPTLSFETDYDGECRGSWDSEKEYGEMEISFSGTTSHSYTFTSLLDYGSYILYVKCKGPDSIPSYYLPFLIIPEDYNPENIPPSENELATPEDLEKIKHYMGNSSGTWEITPDEAEEVRGELEIPTGYIILSKAKSFWPLLIMIIAVVGAVFYWRKKK